MGFSWIAKLHVQCCFSNHTTMNNRRVWQSERIILFLALKQTRLEADKARQYRNSLGPGQQCNSGAPPPPPLPPPPSIKDHADLVVRPCLTGRRTCKLCDRLGFPMGQSRTCGIGFDLVRSKCLPSCSHTLSLSGLVKGTKEMRPCLETNSLRPG